jgi:DNA-binding MarR family transcriptional regulator
MLHNSCRYIILVYSITQQTPPRFLLRFKAAFVFTDCYCTQFRRAANALTGLYDDALRAVGLKITQFSLLRALERLGPSTFTEVATELALDKTTISRNLQVVVRAGWVTVSLGSDGRFRVAALTSEGLALLRRAEPFWEVAQKQIERELTRFLRGPAHADLLGALETVQTLGLGQDEIA